MEAKAELLRQVEQRSMEMSAVVWFAVGCCCGKRRFGFEEVMPVARELQAAIDRQVLTVPQIELIQHSFIQGDLPQAKTRLDRFISKDNIVSSLRKSQGSFQEPVEMNGEVFLRNVSTGEITTRSNAKAIEQSQRRNMLEELQDMEAEQARFRREREEERLKSEALARELQEQFDQERKPQAPTQLDCQICYDRIKEEDYLPLEACGHMFHPACIIEFLEDAINQRRFPLICPFGTCKAEVVEIDLQERLSPDLYAKYEEFCFKAYVERNNQEMSCCPTPDCPYVFIWTQEDPHFECPACKKHYCLRCKGDWHKNMTCEENIKLKNPDELDKMFETAMKKTNFKQCPKCQFWVERAFGCDFIKCRCGFAFCYKCGNGFKDCTCGYGYCEKCQHDRVHCNCGFAARQAMANNPPVRVAPVKRRGRRR